MVPNTMMASNTLTTMLQTTMARKANPLYKPSSSQPFSKKLSL